MNWGRRQLQVAHRRRWRLGRVNKVVRRIHLYLGLLMFPWLLFFGLSGTLFNHPNVGETIEATPLPAERLGTYGIAEPWQAEEIATLIVQEMNVLEGGYVLDGDYSPSVEGIAVLSAPSEAGQYTMLVSPTVPEGVVVHRKGRPVSGPAPFAGMVVDLQAFSTRSLEAALGEPLQAPRYRPLRPFRAHPKIAPELRFRVIDQDGEAWNVVANLGTGVLSGRRAEAWPQIGLVQLLGRLHTTHHYTSEVGPLWFWALFEDLLAWTMVLWSISGLWMWWQMKPTRVIGAVAVAVAVLIAACVMGGTASHLLFDNVVPVTGPGGGE